MIEKLQKIQIRGFGANKKLDVEFSPTVTSIVGKSYDGKSWLLRALKWVMTNKPAGDAYINWDSNEAKVRLSLDDKRVLRQRSKSVNLYRFGDKANPYVAFGNDVPSDIAEVMNVSEINFQGQHTLPFWFCETAGEVSRQLNSIVNLEIIDKTSAKIVKEVRDTNIVIEVTEKALKKVMQEKKDLAYVEQLNKDLQGVEALQVQYQVKARECSTIDAKLGLIAKYAAKRERRLALTSDGLKVMSIGENYAGITVSVERLSKLVESAQSCQKAMKNKPPSIKLLGKLREKLLSRFVECDRLANLIELVQDRRQEKCRTERDLQRLKKELEEIADGRCPLCGNQLKS